ncbi:MAG TPA: VPDSG-CTERM sorting domain-containing protein [Verrucomicrobiota bacterium]|nr:hypothetical protein [Verrucomicrobiales bacterium]HRI15655.1 VPDSG-CTERM sorting domain-containing protein [Verrucomicrobiota bacterium]
MNPTFPFSQRSLFTAAALTVGGLLPQANAISFLISSLPGSQIVFTPTAPGEATVGFGNGSGNAAFVIGAVLGGTGSAVGFEGELSGGFNIGPAKTVYGPAPLIETAPVLGLTDASIFASPAGGVQSKFGFTGSAESVSTVQVTGISVTSDFFSDVSVLPQTTDPDLLTFAAGNRLTFSLFITFVPGTTLADLIAHGGTRGFSGTLTSTTTVPDSSSTLGMLGIGLLALLGCHSRRS